MRCQVITAPFAGTPTYGDGTAIKGSINERRSIRVAAVKSYANGSFTYSADPNYASTDSFQYAAYDKDWNRAAGTVTLSVAQGTDLPGPPPPDDADHGWVWVQG